MGSDPIRMLAISGSPRQGGSTDTLLDFFLRGAAAGGCVTERIALRDLDIGPCTACDGCAKNGRCVIRDDMSGLYEKLYTYDRIVCAFPVFFLGPPAIAKAFIDRAQALWVRRFTLGHVDGAAKAADRKGFLLSACGYKPAPEETQNRLFSCSETIVRAFFSACGVHYDGSLSFPGIEGPADLTRDGTIEKRVVDMGRRWVGPPSQSKVK